MRPVLGSTATTAPLYFPSAATAAARTSGSSYVASSVLVESANVGTPGYRFTLRCARERVAPAPAGIAGTGSAHSAVNKIAILLFPYCFTVPTLTNKADADFASNPGLPHRLSRRGRTFTSSFYSASTNIARNSLDLFVLATGQEACLRPPGDHEHLNSQSERR